MMGPGPCPPRSSQSTEGNNRSSVARNENPDWGACVLLRTRLGVPAAGMWHSEWGERRKVEKGLSTKMKAVIPNRQFCLPVNISNVWRQFLVTFWSQLEEGAIVISWTEARLVEKHPTKHKTNAHSKELFSPKCQRSWEKPCCRIRYLLPKPWRSGGEWSSQLLHPPVLQSHTHTSY